MCITDDIELAVFHPWGSVADNKLIPPHQFAAEVFGGNGHQFLVKQPGGIDKDADLLFHLTDEVIQLLAPFKECIDFLQSF